MMESAEVPSNSVEPASTGMEVEDAMEELARERGAGKRTLQPASEASQSKDEQHTSASGSSRSKGLAWEIETGAKPASQRPKAEPRPPKWVTSASSSMYGRGVTRVIGNKMKPGASAPLSPERIEGFKLKQLETLRQFQSLEERGAWDRLHRLHFDWWMFPIDDGSKREFNVSSEAEVQSLRDDADWLHRYHQSVRLAAAGWGWDVVKAERIDPPQPGMAYSGWDVRLAKICRSLYLFHEAELLASMQKFAREVQRTEKNGGSFFYGRICLDELLYFELPR
mmetsp:Transcript_60699/g.112617  ORF Transcript_60699/g.112617 Transcript_60699/m.112617 type:complete len:281 (-) Transcript_60699:85-927(-)